jgi:predicted adenylyl cyclase CyaB
MPVNIEIKARCPDPDRVREILHSSGAHKVGLDHQIDTYFQVPRGRLKLRRGNIENHLIFYDRADSREPKRSDVDLFHAPDLDGLGGLLEHALGIKCVVDKRREIYRLGRAKIHLDEVANLGAFVEIEVIEESGSADETAMLEECHQWMRRLGVDPHDLIADSYSDMLTGSI